MDLCNLTPRLMLGVFRSLFFFENVFLKPPNDNDHQIKPTLSRSLAILRSTMSFIHCMLESIINCPLIWSRDNTIETVVDVLSTHQPAPMRTKSTSSFGNGFPFAVFSSAIFLKWDWTLPAVERFLFKTDKKCTAPSQLTLTLQKGLSTARKFPAGCVHYDLRWVPCMKHRSFVWY